MSFTEISTARIQFGPLFLRVLLFAACLGISHSPATGQERGSTGKSYLFDIPIQPLRDALFSYTEVTGLSVLVDDEVTSGRRSSPVKGLVTAEDALKTLLAGTGLEFQYTTPYAFTLIPTADVGSDRLAARDDSRDESYFAAVQTAVKSALCSRAQTVPGQYRVVLQLWIGEYGVVHRSELLGSTGNADRDQMLSEILSGLPVGKAPPADLPQPVTLVILPRSPNATNDCGPADESHRTKARG
jgi:hypothetical protein